MEKDAKNPYVPSKEMKKKNQSKDTEEDPNKAFLEKLDKEMQNEEKYKPSDKPKKVPVNKETANKKAFMDKLNSELDADKKQSASKALSSTLICYLCYKTFQIPAYASHLKNCEVTWRRQNIGKDPNMLKPEGYDEIASHLSTLTKEQIDKYNTKVFENKDNMVYEPCENCARNIIRFKMEEHLKTCNPNGYTSSKVSAQPPKKNDDEKDKEVHQEDNKQTTLNADPNKNQVKLSGGYD